VTMDRWLIALNAPSTVTVSQITSTIGYPGKSAQMVYTHSAGGYAVLYQNVEQYLQLRGKPVTFALTIKATVAVRAHLYISDGVTATYSAYNVGTGEERLTVTGTPGAATTLLQVAIVLDNASATIEINDATLVVGPAAAAFAPLHPTEDLARCERYYQNVSCTARFTASAAGQILETPLPLRVPMAGTPTATLLADGATANQAAGYPQVTTITDHGGRWAIASAAAGDCFSVIRSVILEYNP
jgi:hypothetical protein